MLVDCTLIGQPHFERLKCRGCFPCPRTHCRQSSAAGAAIPPRLLPCHLLPCGSHSSFASLILRAAPRPTFGAAAPSACLDATSAAASAAFAAASASASASDERSASAMAPRTRVTSALASGLGTASANGSTTKSTCAK
eukprot:359237-Chlamydomonas_euryale.AAC.3